MSVVKYLFAIWAGVLIYAVLSLSFGARGFLAYSQLQYEQARQEANIEELRLINQELEHTMSALLHDEDTVAVFARELGYATAQERFIRIVGLGGYQQTRTAAGEVVFATLPQYVPNLVLRIIAFFTGISILICMLFFDFMKILKNEK
ncbi:MAG: septum formation initiator family protein [Treponema sp.]|nr:septum formation initiator family protein [Treponema sp.]